MRSALALFILSLIPLGCGRLEAEGEKERPKVEKALFEKAAIGFRGAQSRTQLEATEGAKDAGNDSYSVTP